MAPRSPPRDRPASPGFFRQELEAALTSHAHGLGSFEVGAGATVFGAPQASARVQLLEGKTVEICISERGYRAESLSATDFLPANVFGKTFESLDALLPLLSPAYTEATSSELSRKLAALAGTQEDTDMEDSDWLDVSAPQGGHGDPMVEQEWTRMNTRYTDAGYREGIIAGKEAKLQEGFDAGFALAVPNARRLGKLRGRAAALLAYQLSEEKDVGELRELIRDLGKVTREQVLPVDLEAEAHARDEHGEDLDVGLGGDGVAGIEAGVEGLAAGGAGAGNGGSGKRENELLDELEARLQRIAA